jgi:hypothetical protein
MAGRRSLMEENRQPVTRRTAVCVTIVQRATWDRCSELLEGFGMVWGRIEPKPLKQSEKPLAALQHERSCLQRPGENVYNTLLN